MKARVRIAGGDLASAARWAQDRGIGMTDAATYLREYEHLTFARLRLAQFLAASPSDTAGSASLAALLEFLGRMHAEATAAGRDGSVLEIRVLMALVHDADGDLQAAVTLLSRALGEAPEPDSDVRLYVDGGVPMRNLLTAVADIAKPVNGVAGGVDVRGRARALLQRTGAVAGNRGPEQAAVDTLSRREREVLRLLGSDLTGPEIARELFVTVNTLRTHTKRIFTKLDAQTRAVAVRHARERGLL